MQSLKTNIKNIITIGLPILLVSLLFAFLTAYAERNVDPENWTVLNTFWWWIVTIASVGYGDIVPLTALGKVFSSVVIISSFLFLGLFVSEISYLIKLTTNRELLGLARRSHKNHVVILGENSLLKGLIEYIKEINLFSEIVIVTDKYTENPFTDVHFIKGDPKDDAVLELAGIKNAKAAIILADDRVNNPDAYSLVISNEVEKINPKVKTLSELVDSRFKKLFEEANLDSFITEKALMEGVSDYRKIEDLLSSLLK